jgi:hypothetical protein
MTIETMTFVKKHKLVHHALICYQDKRRLSAHIGSLKTYERTGY